MPDFNTLDDNYKSSNKSPLPKTKKIKLTKWFVKIGDLIEKGQLICEVETEKFTMEFESFYVGKLVSIAKPNTFLNVNDELCIIEEVK